MGGKVQIEIPKEKIAAFCRKWKIAEAWPFGSALREDFKPESDVDVLVRFAPGAKWRFHDRMDMEEEIAAILGRKVDLIERRLVEQSENYIRRKHILSHLEPLYVAG
ncbi:MAG: DNA polymerase subunit beta [Candidatus Tectomicrobia bacterium RIFCSPLOWO2_12_FULL_69_37]|nr:MAG: DNA polymerase subunit beta [Candidatus Tectomicrobia bacterium RIFCSPLOWO2_12_FULL_69_37]